MNFQNLNFDYVEQPRRQPPVEFQHPPQPHPQPQQPQNFHYQNHHYQEPQHTPPLSSIGSEQTLRGAAPVLQAEYLPPTTDSHSQSQSQAYSQSQPPYAPTPPPILPPSPIPSEPEIYGPDRHYETAHIAVPQIARTYGRPVVVEGPVRRASNAARPPLPQYQQPEWEASLNASMLTDFRDDLARLDGVVTPGVDDTPYIQYAIEALTRDRDTGYSAYAASTSDSTTPGPAFDPSFGSETDHRHHHDPDQQQAPMPIPPPVLLPNPQQPSEATRPEQRPGQNRGQFLEPPRPNPQASADSLASTLNKPGQRPIQPFEWRPVDRDEVMAAVGEAKAAGVPPLDFRPRALRAPAFFGLMALCIAMIAALIFSAVYSELRQGLVQWESMYGGRYFLFRFLPQLLGFVVLFYAQFLITTVFRVLPFARLASDLPEEREGALFQTLYPSFLWPKLVGPWNVWVPTLVTWLMNMTIPLLSSVFAVVLKDNVWTWATVQGVAWTLAALYLLLLASTVIVWRYWASFETTGLIWDPRSMADIAAIVSDTNVADDYRATQLAKGQDRIRWALRRCTTDRLGYWTWKDGRPGFWHTLGSPMDNGPSLIADLTAGQRMDQEDEKKTQQQDYHDVETASGPRHQYLPWCLRTSQLVFFAVACFILLLALFVVSFLPATTILRGFRPALLADPQPGAFSAANFFYSFVPSFIGMVLFLMFQSMATHLKILQPWAALQEDLAHGASAQASLLADYAACFPLLAALRAVRNRHWRLAVLSLLSVGFALVPALAGGVFMALTAADDIVRMYPNAPAFYFLLVVLAVYAMAVCALLPRRAAFRLPHGVTCLGEVVGYLTNAEMRDELAFKRCRSKRELEEKLGVGREAAARWVFGGPAAAAGSGSGAYSNVGAPAGGVLETGPAAAGAGAGEVGVRRLRKFTEKRRVRKSQIRRGAGRPVF